MSAILNKKIIKNYNSNLPYNEILKLSPISLVHFNELKPIAHTIIEYFGCNISKSSDDKLFLQTTSGKNQKISLNLQIAFGFKLSKMSGNRITDKLKKLLDINYLVKKLIELQMIYKEVYFLSKSNYSYVTDVALTNYQKKINFYNQSINSALLLSSSGTLTVFKKHYFSKQSQNSEHCHTTKEVKQLAAKTNKSWLSATITCPSNFHITPQSNSKSWDGKSTPLDANEFQNIIWENTLRKLAKININPFGHWTKEANKSGALHRHVLIYASVEELNITKKWLTHYTKMAYKKLNHKFTKRAIHFDDDSCDNHVKLNKVVNYLNKTLRNKNKTLLKSSEKVEAHAHLYKYRRFGFFGLQKSLSNWRLLKQFVRTDIKTKMPTSLKKLLIFAKNNEFHKFLLSPLKNLITKVVHECNFAKNKVVGFGFHGQEFIFKQRYFDFYEQLLNNLSLRVFFDIKNINFSSLSTSY